MLALIRVPLFVYFRRLLMPLLSMISDSFAAVTVCTRVDGLFTYIPARTLCPARPRHNESPPLGALVDIFRRKVVHVLPPPDVLLPFALLAHFVVVRLDVDACPLSRRYR